ncbi:hypothetical protein [Pedobacter hartonius]|uniref:Uncharacterized protein n=1 Tax=Pedobacter hartonius TaxID=425514 RepID=A0A1H4GST0_9SPHI|nr:hypothetical protein [Pedobacter hartonius]SEB12110.1 hypothetical protein SAMN05443550_11141 [Pedobacter hartonius]
MNRQLFISILLFISFESSGQIVLTDQPIPLKPEGFYISGVTDVRSDKNGIGQILVAINHYIRHNLHKDQSLSPVLISIKELNILETGKTDQTIDGRLKLGLSFSLQKDYGAEHLVDYQAGLHYTRADHLQAALDEYLRTIFNNGLVYFNNWMKDNAGTNRKLAKGVDISFTDYTEKTEGDTIYYSAKRPLTWADFQSTSQPPGRFGAQVIPGIGYTQQVILKPGMVSINLHRQNGTTILTKSWK